MASVESSPPHRVNFADTQSRQSAKAVGRLGPWQLVRLMHDGEVARVYLARPGDGDAEQPASYVIKMLRKEWWRDAPAIEMQRRAAWLGQKMTHPHLLPVLSANVSQAPFYFVTPKLNGHSLAEILQAGGAAPRRRLTLPLMLWIVRQVAEALSSLHQSAGMIHADVKPNNIIVSRDGHATLIDLGFAHAPSEAKHWSSRAVVGTLSYVAPEAVTSSLAAAPASDLYSLGVTLYEMIAGRLPFDACAPDELVRMHREMKPPCVRHAVADLPKPVASLVHRLLAKDPLRRPESAEVVVEELMRLEIESFSDRATG